MLSEKVRHTFVMNYSQRGDGGSQDPLDWSALVQVVLGRVKELWAWSGRGRGGIGVFQG